MKAIVCKCLDNSIGRNNKVLCPSLIKHQINEHSDGDIIIMGRHTFESLGYIEDKVNIILSSKLSEGTYMYIGDKLVKNTFGNILVFNSLENLQNFIEVISEDVYIIGGASIFAKLLPFTDKIYAIEINEYGNEDDIKFPELSKYEWKVNVTADKLFDDDSQVSYRKLEYTRRILE